MKKEIKSRESIIYHILPAFLCLISPVIVFITLIFFQNFSDKKFEILSILSFAGLLYSPLILIKSNRFQYLYALMSFLILSMVIFMKVAYFHLYTGLITNSSIYILLETNYSEVSEYLNIYFDRFIALLLVYLLVPGVIGMIVYRKLFSKKKQLHYHIELFKKKKFIQKINLILDQINQKFLYRSIVFTVILIASIYKFNQLKQYNIIPNLLEAYQNYQQETEKCDNYLSCKQTDLFQNVVSNEDSLTCVVVIGESQTRNNMSIYNYYRETNPLLNKIKDRLYLFDNVRTPHSHTLQALCKALTTSAFEEPKNILNGSIIQLMNKAGFKTYWISNQQPVGAFESIITKIAKASSEQYYTNLLHNDANTPFDEIVLNPLKKALKDQEKKKIIFIHLLGNHVNYKKRYPSEYNVFHDTPKTKFHTENAYDKINSYDNATRYNDFVINNIIKTTEAKNENSFVLYFADHGEEVFDSVERACHEEFLGTRNLFEIPFILWLSDKYKAQNTDKQRVLIKNLHQPFSTENLMFFICDLSNINFDGNKIETTLLKSDK